MEDVTRKPLLNAAIRAFLILLALLPWMKHGLTILNLDVYPMDFMFVVTFALWVAALATRQTTFRFDRSFWLLAVYFAAMAASALVSVNRPASAFKLLTQLYLLLLPVLAYNLVRTEADFRRTMAWWLVPALAVAGYGVATLLLFPFFGWNSFLEEPLHHFGTLPPGPYPRIELTFTYPSILANYLGVSVMLLLLARHFGWVGRRATMIGSAALLASGLFALTPGFGGALAAILLWTWCSSRAERPLVARAAFVLALGLSILEVLVAAIAPVVHPTAPFLIHVPGLAHPLAPSVRLMAWIDAAHEFLRFPIFGHGIGVDAVHVAYLAPQDTEVEYVTDAHNFLLNIAAQCGLVGLGALLLIVWSVLRRAVASAAPTEANPLLFGLAIAWIGGFLIEGMVGSFEDTRHLWILLGLIASARSLVPAEHRRGA